MISDRVIQALTRDVSTFTPLMWRPSLQSRSHLPKVCSGSRDTISPRLPRLEHLSPVGPKRPTNSQENSTSFCMSADGPWSAQDLVSDVKNIRHDQSFTRVVQVGSKPHCRTKASSPKHGQICIYSRARCALWPVMRIVLMKG